MGGRRPRRNLGLESLVERRVRATGSEDEPIADSQLHPIARQSIQPATGLMTLGFRKFSFDPFQSVTVIPGKVDHDRRTNCLA